LLEQHSVLERAGRVAEIVGATVARFRVGQRAFFLEQPPESQRAGSFATAIGRFGTGEVSLLGKQIGEPERFGGIGAVASRPSHVNETLHVDPLVD
jgi:hypothetical protein